MARFALALAATLACSTSVWAQSAPVPTAETKDDKWDVNAPPGVRHGPRASVEKIVLDVHDDQRSHSASLGSGHGHRQGRPRSNKKSVVFCYRL